MIVIVFVRFRVVQLFRVVKIHVKVVYSDGFPVLLVPQTTYCWGPPSFTDSSSSVSILISRILLLLCHVGLAGVCCLLCIPPSELLRGLLQFRSMWPGLAHPKQRLFSRRLLYSLLDRLSCGLLLVASRSIASPPCVVVTGLKVPLSLLGCLASTIVPPLMFFRVARRSEERRVGKEGRSGCGVSTC